jgi:DNA-directed RNA polymerase subunit RPC12/RpoP
MGHKLVCFNCRKAFNRDINNLPILEKCQECGEKFVRYPHLFKPPKKDDKAAWKVVRYLYDHGFIYHHIWETITIGSNGVENYQNYAKYPDNMIDAKDFVIKYKAQALK